MWTSETNLPWASSLPHRVQGIPPMIKVACGSSVLVAEAEEGTLWALGDNFYGQLASATPTALSNRPFSK